MPSATAPARHRLTGICPAARAAVLAELARAHPAPVWLVVAETMRAAEQLAEDVPFFLRIIGAAPAAALLFPESLADSRDMREAFNASSDRLAALSRLRAQRSPPPGEPSTPLLIFSTPAALLQPVPAAADYAARELVLARGQPQPFQALIAQLRALDYDGEAICEAPGQYAVRGGLIDIYPITATQPCRLDFFGDQIEDIRAFDPVTQRSGDRIERITLAASPRLLAPASRATLADYLPAATRLTLIEPPALEELFDTLADETATNAPARPSETPFLEKCAACFGLGDLDLASRIFDGAADEATWDSENLAAHRSFPPPALLAPERLQAEEEARRAFLLKTADWRAAGRRVIFVLSREGEEKRAREILAGDPEFKAIAPEFHRGPVNEGFLLAAPATAPAALRLGPAGRGLVVVTETEIFGRQRPRRTAAARRQTATPSQIDQLLDFSELVEGDFVVHLQHGIALYRGLAKLDTAQGLKEVISLEFDDRVTLHVPLSESHLISRYVGLSKVRPQLGRIGTGRWEKARQAAERATLDLAAELLAIQARREAQPGQAFPPDSAWQREFEASFPFTETRDQLKAIADAKADLERARPMDRLICGDVGFGKTEVAIRAAFKAADAGRQVAVLVPTTVLAQQHLNTFRERMAGYPIAVEMLSRFRTRTEQRRILEATAAGQVDILIGTHRLIQADVRFKDLGLVVIDEEQRFGVKHKEVFKQWRASVDILSMSATPIPRTLYLALTGARDLSVIETAPVNRHPIQTIVKTYDENLVVEAVRHEVRRGGQVFYLHNRVLSIDLVAQRLRALLPDLQIGVGHGQMEADGLERVMTDFVAGKYHVLVCTTIIESGLDIPNCNTLIIEGADRFGLAQLYQIRGRVGRFRHQAYAYLLLHRHTRLLDVARQRLSALRQHNQLGAGFRIAMRDLELRGAGNLLGPEQSGHIAGVGFELYCQLLRQSVARLKGETVAAAIRATVKLDFVFVGEGAPDPGRRRYEDGYTAVRDAELAAARGCPPIQARLPHTYIAETRLRIDFYRRLALADTLPAVRQVETDLRDRFGKFGDEVRALLLITEIRIRAEQKKLLSVETEANRLKCLRNSARRDDFVRLGSRFPRLTAPRALPRMKEIVSFLNNLPS